MATRQDAKRWADEKRPASVKVLRATHRGVVAGWAVDNHREYLIIKVPPVTTDEIGIYSLDFFDGPQVLEYDLGPRTEVSHVNQYVAQQLKRIDDSWEGWLKAVVDRSHFPHTCPACAAPAYVGCVAAAVDCSAAGCRHHRK